jgi:hypothetical protein
MRDLLANNIYQVCTNKIEHEGAKSFILRYTMVAETLDFVILQSYMFHTSMLIAP